MASPPNLPTTIIGLAHAAYPSIAMLAGMQLDVFTPLKDGPLPCRAIAEAIGVKPEKLGPLLYALAQAGLLTVEGGAFANTQEADHFLVRGRPAYMGSAHELFADLWAAALGVARSIRAGAPHAKHDFAAMSDEELGGFFRGLHPSALATGRQFAATEGFSGVRSLLDVGGGSGGLAIGACQAMPALRAAVAELPRVAPIARSFVAEAGLTDRIRVFDLDVAERPPEERFEAAVLRNLIQVLSPDQARPVLRNVGAAVVPGGTITIVGHVLQDSRAAPETAVGINLVFLSVYEAGQAYTEGEHRAWLAEAGFGEIEIRYGAGPGGTSIVTARKVR